MAPTAPPAARARRALYHGARAAGMDDGRADVLRRLAADEPFYWGLDVVFSDLEKRRLYRPGGAPDQGSRAASVVSGYYRELLRAPPECGFPAADVMRGTVEPAARAAAHARRQVLHGAFARSARAFLDHELVSYALSLPQHAKISGGETKKVLKEAVADVLPAEVVHRPKQGFRVPLPAWLAGPLSKWAEERLFSGRARELDFLDFGYIEHLWHRHRAGKQIRASTCGASSIFFSWYEHWFA